MRWFGEGKKQADSIGRGAPEVAFGEDIRPETIPANSLNLDPSVSAVLDAIGGIPFLQGKEGVKLIKLPQFDASKHSALLQLDDLAMHSMLIATGIKGCNRGQPFECTVIGDDYYGSGQKIAGIIIDSKTDGLFTSADTICSAMMYAANVLAKADVDWDSLWIKSSKCPVKRKELVTLVRRAWYQSFGLES